MALEATHIRFALDLKDNFGVKEIEKYISGTIYPDSRYISGIDRDLTHNEDILNKNFGKNDFRKGWQVHQICDNVQYIVQRKNLAFLDRHVYHGQEESKWVEFTAVKIIQDMFDVKAFDLESNLKYLEYVNNPNGEDIEKVRKYNQIIIDLYQGRKEVTLDEYIQMWHSLGIDDDFGEKVGIKTEEFLKDNALLEQIRNCYDEVLEKSKEDYIALFT